MAPRHTNRYTEAQKKAILKAMIVDGHTGAMTARLAATGGLGVPAFEIKNTRYLYQLRKRRREEFEAGNEEAMANSTQAELKRLHALNLAKARRLDGKTDVAENARTAKALAESYRALQGAQAKPAAKPKPSTESAPDGASAPTKNDALSSLIALATQAPKSGSTTRAPTDAPSASPAHAA